MSDGLGNGGAERQFTLLARHLPGDVEARVFSLGAGPFADVLRQAGIDVSVFPRRHRADICSIAGMRRAVLDWCPDIVHSWGWISSLSIVVDCRRAGTPLIDSTIRMGRRPPRFVPRLGQWMAIRGSDVVIANSRAGLRAWAVPLERGRVIYNGVDLRKMHERVHRSHSALPMVVCMSARMAYGKDFDTFLDCAEYAVGSSPGRFLFLLIGDGGDKSRLERRAAALVDAKAVEFFAPGLDAVGIMGEADIGVLLSNVAHDAEGCSNALLEFMALGVPVIATASGGTPEIVGPSEGFLIPPGDSQALFERLTALADDSGLWQSMSASCLNRIARSHTIEGMVRQYMEVYELLVNPNAENPHVTTGPPGSQGEARERKSGDAWPQLTETDVVAAQLATFDRWSALENQLTKIRYAVGNPSRVTHACFARYELRRSAEQVVVDVGFGSGANLFWFKPPTKLVGIEISPRAILEARRRAKARGFSAARFARPSGEDSTSIDCPPDSVDVCVCSHTLEHVYDDERLLRELRRVLKRSGLCFILVPLDEPDSSGVLSDAERLNPDFPAATFHVRRYNSPSLASLAEAAGFRIIENQRLDAIAGQRLHYGRARQVASSLFWAMAPHGLWKALDRRAQAAGWQGRQGLMVLTK